MRYIFKLKKLNIVLSLIILIGMNALDSCSKWNDFEKYIKDGETIYSGKVDSIQILPGFYRVRFVGKLSPDPKVKNVKIIWSDGLNKDSANIALSNGHSGILDTILKIGLEGTLNFKIQTFDDKGNTSLINEASGLVYGNNFTKELPNRPIASAVFGIVANRLRINWGQMDRTLNPFKTVIQYVNLKGDTVSVTTPMQEDATVIENVKVEGGLRYYTDFLPDSAVIDTLSSLVQTIRPYTAFSDSVATLAFNSFYNNFFDPSKSLFYLNTSHEEIASGWTQAIFFDIMLDNYARTKKPADLDKIKIMYQGAYARYGSFVWADIKNKNGWIYDDMLWMIVALIKGYNVTGEKAYLDTAISGLDFVWNDAYDPAVGAIKWSWKDGSKAYMATSNYPYIIAAMMLYNITRDEAYLDKAKKIYNWTRNNLFRPASGRVADHVVGNDPPGFEDYTCNQGTCIGANILLYKATGEAMYLNDAIKAADYTKNNMSNVNGILVAEDYGERGVFKAIFAQYIHELIYDMGQRQYLPWIKSNIASAWFNRDLLRNLMFLNYTVPTPTSVIKAYEACSGVAFMQLFNPELEN